MASYLLTILIISCYNKLWPQVGFGLLVTCVAASSCHWCCCSFTALRGLDQYECFPNHRKWAEYKMHFGALFWEGGWVGPDDLLCSFPAEVILRFYARSFLITLCWLFLLSRLLLFHGLLVVVWGSKAIPGCWALTISLVDQHLLINHYKYLLCPVTNTTRGLLLSVCHRLEWKPGSPLGSSAQAPYIW